MTPRVARRTAGSFPAARLARKMGKYPASSPFAVIPYWGEGTIMWVKTSPMLPENASEKRTDGVAQPLAGPHLTTVPYGANIKTGLSFPA